MNQVIQSVAIENDTIWCVIPVFNHADTLSRVAATARQQVRQVLVVDDGSTDADVSAQLAPLDVTVIRHPVNRGKGAAILTAASHLATIGARWMITLDADGQHDPEDLAAFLEVITPATADDFVVIGVRDMESGRAPRASRFGRNFSDGWVRIETGQQAVDTQSGFRAYPVRHLARLAPRCRHYDFEIEALVRLLWGGLHLRHVPVSVWYPPIGTPRLTHFRPGRDNLRLSCLHAWLVTRRLLPWPHFRLVARPVSNLRSIWRWLYPWRFIKELLGGHASPFELAISSGIGIFLGTLPLIACHSLAIAYVTLRLRMNAAMSLSIQSLCMPPFVPVLCIETGHLLRYGCLLSDMTWVSRPSAYLERLWEWLLGSLVVAPLLAAVVAGIVFGMARMLSRRAARESAS
jgi:glycosyltransferase involved in cell wall biosynthesis